MIAERQTPLISWQDRNRGNGMQVSDVVKGLEWVGINHKLPAVVTMSLGVQVITDIQH